MKRKNSVRAIAAVERAEGKMLAIATDETLDRQGDVLPIESWDVKAYKKNPVLLWAHDYSLPPVGIAKNLRIDREQKRMTFEPVFHGITQLSREVKEMFESDPPIMNSFSVGFIPHFERMNDRDKLIPLELLEISAVPVPANPSARVTPKAMEFDDASKKSVSDWLAENDSEMPVEKIKTYKYADGDVCCLDCGKPLAPEQEKERAVEGKANVVEIVCSDCLKAEETATTMEVQSLSLSKEKFKTQDAAMGWLKEHGFMGDKATEGDNDFTFEQFEKAACQDGSQSVLDLDEGVKAAICRREKAVAGEFLTLPMVAVLAMSGECRALKSANEKLEASAAAQAASGQAGGSKGREATAATKTERINAILLAVLKNADREIGLALKEAKK